MLRITTALALSLGVLCAPALAQAHTPEVYGHTDCVNGMPQIGWDVISSNPLEGWTHPEVVVQASLDGGAWFTVETGEFMAPAFGFSGTMMETTGATELRLRARAVGPWSDNYWWEGPFYADGWLLSEAEATVFAIPTDCEPLPPTNPGTGTPGYWRNHPEAWPVATIMVGADELDLNDGVDALSSPTKGDKTVTMARAVIAATLNVEIDNDSSCIDDVLTDAQNWLTANPLGSKVKANSTAWQNGGETLATTLDDYNNGLLCAPPRD